jgi:hypothetical protein
VDEHARAREGEPEHRVQGVQLVLAAEHEVEAARARRGELTRDLRGRLSLVGREAPREHDVEIDVARGTALPSASLPTR